MKDKAPEPVKKYSIKDTEKFGYRDLPEIIQHYIENRVINVIPLRRGTKAPKLSRVEPFRTRQYPLRELKRHRGNFGVITGSNGKGWSNLVILDIDDKKGPEGLYRHFKDIDTLHVQTALKGYHLYFWSDTPITDVNYIGNLFGVDIELRGKREIYCVLPPSSIYYEKEDQIGGHQIIKTGGKYPLKELKDPDEYIKQILIKAGYQMREGVTKKTDTTTTTRMAGDIELPQQNGTWEFTIPEDNIPGLVEKLKPLYKSGQRQKLVLALSGWMYRSEVKNTSALEVVEQLTKDDPEQEQRITALKNSYRGDNPTLLAGSGVYQLIHKQYEEKYKDIYTDIDDFDKRDRYIEKETKNAYGELARLIVDPLSMGGIKYEIKDKKYKNDGLRAIIRFIKGRYNPIVDIRDEQVYMYNYDEGCYEKYGNKKFKQWIDHLFPGYQFFQKDTNNIKEAISNLQEADEHYLWFENGLLNTETLEFEDHTPDIFTKQRIRYNYNPEATGTFIESKLREILIDQTGPHKGEENKYQFFLQWIGYCFLSGNPFHTMLFITGTGGNGKSVLSNLIYQIFDQLVSSVPLHDFYSEYGKMGLIGKKINVVYDLPKKMLKDTGEIKAVTGEDNMTIKIKYQDPWTGKLPVKVMGMGNHLPKVTDASEGFWQRVAHFETTNTFRGTQTEDKDLKTKFREDKEGIEWLIHTSIKSYQKGPGTHGRAGWALPIGTEQTQTDYLRLSNPCYYAALQLFEKTQDRHDFITKEEVVKMITKLLRKEKLEIPAHNGAFYQAIRNIGGEDGPTSKIVDGKKINLEGFRMVKPKKPQPSFQAEDKFKIDPERMKDLARNVTGYQQKILNELSGYGFNRYSDLVETLEIETTLRKEEIDIELIELINNGVVIKE